MKKEYNPNENATVFSISHSDISKTAQRQCANHTWQKLNDNEVACTLCPTVLTVDNIDDYVIQK